ncbi:MAG: class I SAM-dependent methyltransferase [Deltaproteobacteria bacterium]|nr:class I SAM-dependent methyltransferase [Deltaproteobacteria bacterium]MDZ4342579.1 class I SAM-dependent methyltransferase [Candidatus Binatia bacterium]
MTSKSSELSETYLSSERADAWQRESLRRKESSGAATEMLLNLADLRAGDRVLEVAAGTGDQALMISRRIGSSGQVVAVDISSNMLAHAAAAAREAGLANVETRVMNAEKLDFEADSFDAVLCRFALMLFPNPTGGLAEMLRVVKPTRKVAVMVWSTAEKNPFHGLPLQVVRNIGNLPAPASGRPGLFSLSGAGDLEGVYRDEGFSDVAIHAAPLRRKYASLQDAIQGMKSTMVVLQDLMAKLSAADQARAWEQIERGMSSFVGPNGFDAPGEALIAVGTK